MLTDEASRGMKAKHLYPIVQGVFGPDLEAHGFVQVRRAQWVRGTKAPIRELVEFLAPCGSCSKPIYGVSLDYVPHVSHKTNGQIQWHDSDSTAVYDLFYDPIPYGVGPVWVGQWTIPCNHGLDAARRGARSIKERVLNSAFETFSAIRSIEDLPSIFEAKLVDHRGILPFSYSEQLADAFTLAMLGRDPEAKAWLARFEHDYHPLPRKTARELEEHIGRILSPRAG